jgi:hypothetical protein
MSVSGGTAPYTYSVVGTLPAGLTLNTTTGAVSGTPTASGTFSIKVTDANGATSTSCNITINPALSVTCAANLVGEVGVAYSSGAMSVSGGTAPYTYSVVGTLPAGLTLSTSTGAVTGTPTAAGTFSVKVTDANGATSTSCNITINAALSVTCAANLVGEVGVAYNSGAMSVSGGTAPYTYSIVGTLPAGLTLNSSTGAVTGTPTAAGTFSIKVTDANGATSTSCNITINPALSVTCAANLVGEVSVAYNSGAMSVSGGTAPYTYSVVGTLPAGLTLNTTTGAVSGTPTASGTFSIKVTDANGASSTSCSITINPALSVTCAANLVGEVGVAYSSGAMSVSGGTAPYTYSVVGTLPAGLTLNTSTGAVTGTPTASGTFQVKATDAKGATGTACAITINTALTFTCPPNNSGTVGEPFNSGNMTVSGGTTPYSFSIVGTLPAGLTLNPSTGAVSGTPTAQGSFALKVTDALGVTGTTCAITINDQIWISCGGSNTGMKGQPFDSGPATVSGGMAPYTFSVVGTLPAGLTLNPSTGEVTGTPTSSGTFSIQVIDSMGKSATADCTITDGVGYTLTVNPSSLTVVAGQSATTTFTFAPVGGFVGTISFSCSGLPAGTTCVFVPPSVTADGSNKVQTSTLTITTTSSGTANIGQNSTGPGPTLASFFLLPALLLGSFIAWRRRSFTRRVRGMMLLLLVGIIVAGGVVGCGGSIIQTVTPLGSHSVTVVAKANISTTMSDGSSSTQTEAESANFTLTVIQ